MVTIWNRESFHDALVLASGLRRAGLRVDLYPEADKLGKQLKYASSRNMPFVVVVGDVGVPCPDEGTVVGAEPTALHAAWQAPAMQLPVQQGGAPGPQERPLGVQLAVPQTLPMQAWLQHWSGLPQGEPSGEHTVMPQIPPAQTPEQHCPALEQVEPSTVHCCALQVLSLFPRLK